MGKKVFTVQLTDNKVVYYGGDTINGNLVLDNDETFSATMIEVAFSGKAFVQWTEGGGENSTTYTEKQKFFKHKAPVTGSTGSEVQLSVGRSTFPFSFNLPRELPTSVEVEGGWVRYSIKGLVKRPGLSRNLQTKMLFTVLDVLDLNLTANPRVPSAMSDSKTLCCCCCASGPIEGKVNADKTGYVPGEFVRANGSIENLSNSNMRNSHYSFVREIVKHSGGKSGTLTEELVKAPGLPCYRRSTVQIPPQTLQIPPVPPSHLRYCAIMDIEYFLQLTVVTPRCTQNLKVRAPLEIGTIPLQGEQTEPGQAPVVPPIINTVETSFQPLASTNIFGDQTSSTAAPPPPSYAAATSVTIPQKKEYDGPTTYAPQYNYYDWSLGSSLYK